MRLIFQVVRMSISAFRDSFDWAMHRHKRGTHHVIHDMPQTNTEIEIVPVAKGIHESSAYVVRGPWSSLNDDLVSGIPSVCLPAINARSLFSRASQGMAIAQSQSSRHCCCFKCAGVVGAKLEWVRQ